MNNFYNTLGVNKTATQDEIKKAYRKLAVEHHPDKGGDESKFKEISEAYDTLGNEDKRRQYDLGGSNPFGGGGGSNPFDDFFRGFGQRARKKAVPETIIDINVGTIESYLGSEKIITFNKKDKCNTCSGSGGDKSVCGGCNGNGFTTVKVGNGLFSQMVRQTCNRCQGEGHIFKTRCGTCNGSMVESKVETIKIKLPVGIDNGQFLRLQGKGDYHRGTYGNLIVKINITPEGGFEKEGDSLIYYAIFGKNDLDKTTYTIPHPSGDLTINMPKTFNTLKPLRVKTKGFNGGDLYVNLVVQFERS